MKKQIIVELISIDLLPSTTRIAGLILLCSTEDEFDFGRLSKSNANQTKNVKQILFSSYKCILYPRQTIKINFKGFLIHLKEIVRNIRESTN